MMMTVDYRINRTCDLRQLARFQHLDPVRRTITRRSLLMLNGFRDLRADVLNQRASARDIQYLHSETDREQRYSFSFSRLYDQQISLILDRLNRSKRRMRLLTITQRVNIGIAT